MVCDAIHIINLGFEIMNDDQTATNSDGLLCDGFNAIRLNSIVVMACEVMVVITSWHTIYYPNLGPHVHKSHLNYVNG